MAYSKQQAIDVLVASGMPESQARAILHLQAMRDSERSTRLWKLISAFSIFGIVVLNIVLWTLALT